jgi:hypothetical protein
MAGDKHCAMIGANIILHLHEGTAVIGAGILVTTRSDYVQAAQLPF